MKLFCAQPCSERVWVKSECTWFVFISESNVLRCSRYSGDVIVVSDDVVSERNDSFNYVFSKPAIRGEKERQIEGGDEPCTHKKGLKVYNFFPCDLTFRKHLLKKSQFVCALSWIKMINEMQTSAIMLAEKIIQWDFGLIDFTWEFKILKKKAIKIIKISLTKLSNQLS